MSIIDLLLIVAMLGFAVSGYRQGFVVGVLSLTGFLVGGAVGLWLAPELLGQTDGGLGTALLALGIVLGLAIGGQILATMAGTRLRGSVTSRVARTADAAGGALVSVCGLLLGAWLIASLAVQVDATGGLSSRIRDSKVLTTVDEVIPRDANAIFQSFGDLLDSTGFPRVFGALAPERILPVDPPDPTIAADPGAPAQSLVKVVGIAEDCRQRLEGSGFVYATQRVMTNAHVVAGVERPQVQVAGTGKALDARVIVFDPGRDVAVLAVPDLAAPALSFGPPARRGADVIVAGFPNDGPLTFGAARVRSVLQAEGEDIYGRSGVTREVYSLRANVQPGNSGGPLLAPDGSVLGVVFAASVDDPETGYALTAAEVGGRAEEGLDRTEPVSTGPCE
ncbi:MAG: MarP family serine protease [Candidatus Nanopelagicales bacterium]